MSALHRYFRVWERIVPPVYRVAAVVVGAVVTAVGMATLTRSAWLLHIPLALMVWALLGKVEGDARDRELERRQRGYPFGGGGFAGVREPRRPAPRGGAASGWVRAGSR